MAFKPDNPNILVSGSICESSDETNDETIKMWDITSGSCLSIGHTSAVRGVAFSADGQWLIAGSEDGVIRLLDAHPRGGTVVSAV